MLIRSLHAGDQPDLDLTWTENGWAHEFPRILDTYTKVQDGEKGNPEVAKLTFTGSDSAATLNIDFGYTNVDVEVEAGDSNITVANKAFEKISTEAIFGYVASNNGDGSITFTSSFNSDMGDMEVNVKVKE
ncbi:hypothetical protein [Cytobacillus gottheilii]|uniref:hypothetical protein n=1 Tax=Cytobacillus gottheilii TaxID=859144 RepID=UPI003CE788E5